MASTGLRVRLVAINGSAGAFVTIFGTILSRRIEVLEDFSANAGVGQGITFNLPDPVNTTNDSAPVWAGPYSLAPQTEPIKLGDDNTVHAPFGAVVSNGPGVIVGVGVTPALPFIQVRSASTNATVVRVSEFA